MEMPYNFDKVLADGNLKLPEAEPQYRTTSEKIADQIELLAKKSGKSAVVNEPLHKFANGDREEFGFGINTIQGDNSILSNLEVTLRRDGLVNFELLYLKNGSMEPELYVGIDPMTLALTEKPLIQYFSGDYQSLVDVLRDFKEESPGIPPEEPE